MPRLPPEKPRPPRASASVATSTSAVAIAASANSQRWRIMSFILPAELADRTIGICRSICKGERRLRCPVTGMSWPGPGTGWPPGAFLLCAIGNGPMKALTAFAILLALGATAQAKFAPFEGAAIAIASHEMAIAIGPAGALLEADYFRAPQS